MGIVRFALKYPHTFYVVAALILFLGVTAIVEMPTDIFPEIDIPVVSVIWQYTGLNTTEMEQRVTTYAQYAISSNVNGIKDMEAETVNGISVQKLYFQPDVNLSLAIAQTVSATNSIRALMPTGIQPPIVVQYSASEVPVLQVSLSSDTLNESQLYDYGLYTLRQMLAPIHGLTLPTPAGGKYRQIMVDIDPIKLLAKGLTPLQVVNAVNAQNLTLPGGDEKIGETDYTVRTNSMPPTIEALNDIPVSYTNGATVFLRDIGHVRDGNLVQQNIVRANGKRSVLMSVIKKRQRLDLDCRQCGQAFAQYRAGGGAARHGHQIAVRSIGVRHLVADFCAARRGDRGGAHGDDDPDLPGLMAADGCRDDLDPAGDAELAGRALFPRRDDQHDDIGRPRARGWHSCRRFDGDDREHLPPAR